ncbi:MAG TPA: chromate efflux transporter [Methylomirabilota bacterium]|nr:chromate efflux transporter [Methylomirabilota bacterium]
MTPALAEVARLFLKLGVIGFGGPAAHIALMREEVVRRRRWLSDERFLDLVGMANLIPGPTSTEMSIYLGYLRAGWAGLMVGGACFIGPAMLLVLGAAWLYVRYGATPAATAALYGITPVIIAIVGQAMWGLARTAVKGPLLAVVGVVVLALGLAGVNVLVLLLGGGVLVMLLRAGRRALAAGALAAAVVMPGPAAAGAGTAPVTLGALFGTFLKIGAVLYGSGYVLLAFLRHDFVDRLGWLSDRQLLDAVAVGQFTPGPVFTTATFIGYLLAGLPGALLATLAIFLPSFVFVALSQPVLPRLRGKPATAAFLDGVNVAAVGLMAAVTCQLARAAIVDGFTALLALVALALLLRMRLNSAWLVGGGAAAGLLYRALVG